MADDTHVTEEGMSPGDLHANDVLMALDRLEGPSEHDLLGIEAEIQPEENFGLFDLVRGNVLTADADSVTVSFEIPREVLDSWVNSIPGDPSQPNMASLLSEQLACAWMDYTDNSF